MIRMLTAGEKIVYKSRGIFEVQQVGSLDFSYVNRKRDYYTLQSLQDDRETVYVPTDAADGIRRPMNREEAEELVEQVGELKELWIGNEKQREQEYRKCIASGSPTEWVRILKTLYARTRRRGSITSMDKKYKQVAERALYGELAYALDLPMSQIDQTLWKGRKEKQDAS